MGKLFNIALKDLRMVFRDPGTLIMMLATPFMLTLLMAFAFGGGGGSNVLQHVPLAVVNHDEGTLGQSLVGALHSQGLADLLSPIDLKDDTAARDMVDNGETAAAIIIPSGFSENLTSSDGAMGATGANGGTGTAQGSQTAIELYTNPAKPVSSGVVRSVLESIVSRYMAGSVGGQVAVTQLIGSGLISPQEALAVGREIGQRAALQTTQTQLITVSSESAAGGSQSNSSGGFNWLGYMAPSMAIMFLKFTVTGGGRTILAEREAGTLPRMLVTPTGPVQVVGGKVLGIFVVGLVQMGILIVASLLLFHLHWGLALGVVLLTVALVAAATGWGMLLAAYCRTPAQAGQFGSMLALVFAILAGNLVPRQILPEWLRNISYVTPNAWGLEGYTKLAAGSGLADIALIIVALLAMAAVLFAGATALFRRQYA
jgi:ABC-2 type transport system permease protein